MLKFSKISSSWIFFAILSTSLLIASCSGGLDSNSTQTTTVDSKDTIVTTQPANAPYGIKSGLIVYKTTDLLGKTELTVKFDQYGILKRTEMEMSIFGQKIKNITISDSVMAISWDPVKMTGNRTKIDVKSPDNINFRDLSDKVKQEYNIKEKGTETVLGKTCTIYAMDYNKGELKGDYSVWNGIIMKMKATTKGKEMLMEVIRYEENVSFPADEFKVPQGVVFKDVDAL